MIFCLLKLNRTFCNGNLGHILLIPHFNLLILLKSLELQVELMITEGFASWISKVVLPVFFTVKKSYSKLSATCLF